jgi:hypothetical protein
MNTLLAVVLVAASVSAQADALRDPTRPPQPAAARVSAQEAAPALTAVFASGERRSAIFNGRLVKAGDSVGSYSIEDVLADGVRYRHAGTVHELYLPHAPGTVKKPATAPARGGSGGQ